MILKPEFGIGDIVLWTSEMDEEHYEILQSHPKPNFAVAESEELSFVYSVRSLKTDSFYTFNEDSLILVERRKDNLHLDMQEIQPPNALLLWLTPHTENFQD